ncbi:hypothetical protein IFM89_011710 [Coptis chinensis]|uniref:Uncharacterized protein n=1 Tax=Coptis chinensis TaxID=261450 RepID=A0A835MI33_9MAGN|nr:hypothetical protein IFM89_011710 [Coptis chinensis]
MIGSRMASCGNRNVKLRGRTSSKVRYWVVAINDAGLRPPEGWCHPHRFGSFAPPRGLTEDGSEAQWFVDGQAAFGAIEEAKYSLLIGGRCHESYLRHPFDAHGSSQLDVLMEAKAKQVVQVYSHYEEKRLCLGDPFPLHSWNRKQPSLMVVVSIGGLNLDTNKKLSLCIATILETKLLVPKNHFFLEFYDTKAS